MSDPSQDEKEEWRIWFPIDSKVTDEEIEKMEGQIGYKLPEDYQTFLKHKNLDGIMYRLLFTHLITKLN